MRVILTSQRVKAGQSRTPEDHAVAALGCTSVCPPPRQELGPALVVKRIMKSLVGPLVGPALSRRQAV
jgi:hypothetical protein